jgi:hypothetical protein
MTVKREKTQDELDSEISHDPPGSASTESAPTAAAPETHSAEQPEPAPMIGDYDTVGTTLKPIC